MLRSPRWGQIELKSLLWWHIFARGERRRCQQSDILTFYDIKYGVTDQFVVSDVIFDVTMASAPIKNSKFWIQSIRILTTLRVTQVEICKCTNFLFNPIILIDILTFEWSYATLLHICRHICRLRLVLLIEKNTRKIYLIKQSWPYVNAYVSFVLFKQYIIHYSIIKLTPVLHKVINECKFNL